MQENMFDINRKTREIQHAPLADRMRPKKLDQFVGQRHLLGKGKLLYRLIKADRLTSAIFYGPSGTGKTTLARVIANETKADFHELNAVMAGKKDIEAIIKVAENNLGVYNKRTILFIDEIHRFNKAQQDALLPSVEKGLITLIGATTENPFYEINSPLLSRSTTFAFQSLSDQDIKAIILNAVSDKERGLGYYPIVIEEQALDHWVVAANGDVRKALNALELAALTAEKNKEGQLIVDRQTAVECIQHKGVQYDKSGDNHYDTISAFIKSVRGSDPDAALFWLAKMLEAGEDPNFIARRLVILASEDIGNAEPQGLAMAVAAAHAVQMIGLPEARLNLAQVTTFLAASPKSNASYVAINRAGEALKKHSDGKVPVHLQDKHYRDKSIKDDRVYHYPHNYPEHYYDQPYLPDDLVGTQFYFPTQSGYEKTLSNYLEKIRKLGN